MVLLGEVGGVEEYVVCDYIKKGKITKPVVAWCIGTCAKMFPYEVQFGHAGACAAGKAQTADAKNLALLLAGAYVPKSFMEFGVCVKAVYQRLVTDGVIQVKPEQPPPNIPVVRTWYCHALARVCDNADGVCICCLVLTGLRLGSQIRPHPQAFQLH